MLYASQVCFLWYSPPHHFSGIAKWLWSRCQQWKRLSRPWLTFTTTTWEATSTWESPSPSPPFKNLTHKLLTVPGFTVSELGAQKPFRLCLDTGGDWICFVVGVLLIVSFLKRDWNFWHFLKRTFQYVADTGSSQLLTAPLYFYGKQNVDMMDCPPVWDFDVDQCLILD